MSRLKSAEAALRRPLSVVGVKTAILYCRVLALLPHWGYKEADVVAVLFLLYFLWEQP